MASIICLKNISQPPEMKDIHRFKCHLYLTAYFFLRVMFEPFLKVKINERSHSNPTDKLVDKQSTKKINQNFDIPTKKKLDIRKSHFPTKKYLACICRSSYLGFACLMLGKSSKQISQICDESPWVQKVNNRQQNKS